MQINKLKINGYGKLKEKEINLKNKINIIYGENEGGKSTLLNFITDSFYGISKNKNGKEISNFEKYTPWVGEEFSGKLEYQLDNQEKFEIFRDFRKKNPKIFNEAMEDISKQFNIDKNKGNEFFYEQTKVDEALFLSTVVIHQQEVKLEKQQQNILIQKVANLVGTGEDNVSYKRAIDRINRRILDEVGTERSREKPINQTMQKISELQKQKQELENQIDIKYEIEENKTKLTNQIEEAQKELEKLKQEKILQENEKKENEKINLETELKEKLKNENNEKINSIKNKINQIKIENKKINTEKNTKNKRIIFIFLISILINILQIILIKNKFFNIIFLLTVSTVLIFYLFFKSHQKKKENKQKNKIEKINAEIKQLHFEIEILEKNNKKLDEEINSKKIEKNTKNNLENINQKIQEEENKINNQKIELHKLQLDYKNIEPKLENLANIEESLVDNNGKLVNLKKLEKSMNLAKEVLENSYNKMKNTVTPKFTENLSKTIAKISKDKYNKVKLNDETGLVVELENGNYIPVNRLSIGTIDQLYLSLRLAMAQELSTEKMPILLDEAFAYYDNERLENILSYLVERFKDHQIIIFTCTNREKEMLNKLKIEFNDITI